MGLFYKMDRMNVLDTQMLTWLERQMTAINVRVYVPDQWCSDQWEKQETNMCGRES